jgi:uridine phosphorylase
MKNNYFPPSELVLNADNNVYHLGLRPDQISDKIILVGDQNRVSKISQHFDSVEHKVSNREFCTHTGSYRGKRISVISTGIGTDNIDIVINELDALVNINLTTREEKSQLKQLDIVRIGTCGILNSSIPLHSFILSDFSLGMDNVAHFYQLDFSNEEKDLLEAFENQVLFPEKSRPYLAKASHKLNERLSSPSIYSGITITGSGFYGPQGRKLRLPLAIDSMNESFTSFKYKENQVANFEMESSALFALGNGLGHQCACICLGVANRPLNQFSKGYDKEMNELILHVLKQI